MAIKRIWHGWTTPENAETYRLLLEREVRPGIEAKRIPGYRSLELLSRDLGDEVEFMTIMTFDSLQNVIELQGEDYERAYIPDAARAVLSRWDEVCVHYETGERVEFKTIGTIRSPFNNSEGMPIQPAGAAGVKGSVEVLADYADGLQDLDGFSHIILLYLFHRSRGFKLKVVPFMDTVLRGVFATRAPKRPNPIGLSVVRLEKIEGRVLHVEGVDVLDGTPLFDIKPYVPDFDVQTEIRTGWLEQASKQAQDKRSDGRFA